MKLIFKKLLFIGAGVLLLATAGYLVWRNYKYKIIKYSVTAKILKETNGLYTVTYDSLSFDEVTGNAIIKNIRIIPDTSLAKTMSEEMMPNILLEVKIKSIRVVGAQTALALKGKKIEGDSIIIDHPDITMYSMKPLLKDTKIEYEADSVYKAILGKTELLKVGFVYVNSVNVNSINFFSKEKNFDLINGKFFLEDVLVDSAHNFDTSRVLFCKRAAFTVDSFFSYNHNRKELSVKELKFLGNQKQLLFNEISVNRFPSDTSTAVRLLDAHMLKLSGVNTNQIIQNKNIYVDSIQCKEIVLYEFPLENLKTTKVTKAGSTDSSGFKNVYGVQVNYLYFPTVTFIPFAKSQYEIGNISIRLSEVRAGQMVSLETHPMDFTKEAEVVADRFILRSEDGNYHFDFKNIQINSLQKELQVASFNIIPAKGEKGFTSGFPFQKDRYDIQLSGIQLTDIDMNSLIDKQLVASELMINHTIAKIYRDLHKPLEKKSKVGNYPSQLLTRLDIPINISKAVLKDAYIEYRENEVLSDSIGEISFAGTKLNISNITNVPAEIRKNKRMNISFDTKVLREIPLKGNVRFMLNSDQGDFVVNGHTPSFDAMILNKVSVPMGLIKINSGDIHSINFHLTGNDTSAKGDFLMKYDNLKVEVLKRDKNTGEVKKRGLASLAANAIVKNKNPDHNGLRKMNPEYGRDIYKSFFNLVWKTVFTGMKETVGIQ
ncbi:MAG: hypothetical protein ABI237_18445 [Ginsengibacter sp.]